MRPVLSMMLVCNGTQVSVSSAARSLNLPTTERNINYVVDELRGHILWPNILTAISRLVDYLAEDPSPDRLRAATHGSTTRKLAAGRAVEWHL